MGYDVHFQLVSPGDVHAMLTALREGDPPPPSAFDERPDAREVWAQARAQILGDDPELAARIAGQLVAMWSAASLPFVWTRNFAVTYHPLRMEDELRGVPSSYFGSPRSLMEALPELSWSGTLEDNASIGGYVSRVDSAAQELKEFYAGLAPELHRRVLPLLKLLRAAQRHNLCVLESSDLLGTDIPHPELLHWPGLDRFGLEGGPLTRDEWRRLRSAKTVSYGDLEDIVDRVVEVRDPELRREVLVLLDRFDWRYGYVDPVVLPGLLGWFEGLFAAGAHEDTWPRYFELLGGLPHPRPIRALDPAWVLAALELAPNQARIPDFVRLFGPKAQPPTPELAAALLRTWCRTHPSFGDYVPSYYIEHLLAHGAPMGPLSALPAKTLDEILRDLQDLPLEPWLQLLEDAAPSEQTARWFLSVLKRADQVAPERLARLWLRWIDALEEPPEPRYLSGHAVSDLVARELLQRPPSLRVLRALRRVLSPVSSWSDGEAPWIESLVADHREALFALVEMGLDAGEPVVSLLRPVACRDERWLRGLVAELDNEDSDDIEAWTRCVPLNGRTAPALARACMGLWPYSYESERTLALLAHGQDIVADGLRAWLSGTRAPEVVASYAQRFSSQLINAGYAQQAVAVTELAMDRVPEASRPNLLYNQACAHGVLGDGDRAAQSLQQSIALDPRQRDDAAKDPDFERVRAHPAFAALFGAPS